MSNSLTKQIISAVIILVFSLSLLQPLFASAQVSAQSAQTTIIGSISCFVGGVLADWLLTELGNKLQNWGDALLRAGGKWTNLGNLFRKQAVPILNENNDTKEHILDVAARCVAREVLNDLNARIVGSVRTGGRYNRGTGRGSEPAFVRDWRRFMTQAEHRGEDIFRSVLNSASLCNNVLNLKNVFNANGAPEIKTNSLSDTQDALTTRIGNVNSFKERTNCTMPRGWTMQKYSNDFAGNGSWEAMVRLAEPQNNYYGAMIMSLGELAAQRAAESGSEAAEAGVSGGFLARRGKPGETCLVVSGNGRCVINKDILTPGSILGNSINATIQQELAWITNVDEISELIQYVMANVMGRILDLSKPQPTYDQENFEQDRYPGTWNDRLFGPPSGGTGPTPTATPPGGPTPPAVPPGTVRLCTDINYGGICESFTADDVFLTDNQVGDNSVSSIIMPSDSTTAIIYEHNDFQGISTPVVVSIPDLSQVMFGFRSFNNLISSIRVTGPAECSDSQDNDGDGQTDYPNDTGCTSASDTTESGSGGTQQPPAGSVTFCRDINFGGVCETFTVSDPDFTNNPTIGNDQASSVIMHAGGTTSAELCFDINYSGGCRTITTSQTDLSTLLFGFRNLDNDISSVRITSTPTSGNPECSDGVDNDTNGDVDYAGGPNGEPADPDCNGNPSWDDEGQPAP